MRIHRDWEGKMANRKMLDASSNIRRGALTTVAALVLAISLSSCGSGRPVKYYEINFPPPAPAATEGSAVNATVLVRTFLASHLYREDPIVYATGPEEMGTYMSHRWVEPPTELLQGALVRGLRATGSYKSVMTLRSDSHGDFLLTGHLYDFKEYSGNGGIFARLNFDAELRDTRAGKTVWRHAYNHDEPSGSKDVAGVVSAMNKNVQLSVQEIQNGLNEYFRTHGAQ
jgi:ABC-type uncharacterized transport system auxiliary subunit